MGTHGVWAESLREMWEEKGEKDGDDEATELGY